MTSLEDPQQSNESGRLFSEIALDEHMYPLNPDGSKVKMTVEVLADSEEDAKEILGWLCDAESLNDLVWLVCQAVEEPKLRAALDAVAEDTDEAFGKVIETSIGSPLVITVPIELATTPLLPPEAEHLLGVNAPPRMLRGTVVVKAPTVKTAILGIRFVGDSLKGSSIPRLF